MPKGIPANGERRNLPRAREKARVLGLETFVPSKPCRRGHSLRRTCNGVCIECHREWKYSNPNYTYDYYQKNKNKLREKSLKWKREKQERLAGSSRPVACEVCGGSKKISWDHCHQSGNFRGWLCENCNVAIGIVRENPATMRSLADYLEHSHGNKTK